MAISEQERFEQWAVIELMGHVRMAGRVTEEEHFGVKLGRIDIPRADGTFGTQFFGGQAVYRVTPVEEAVARAVAAQKQPQPVHRWELPPSRLNSAESASSDDEDGDSRQCGECGDALDPDDGHICSNCRREAEEPEDDNLDQLDGRDPDEHIDADQAASEFFRDRVGHPSAEGDD